MNCYPLPNTGPSVNIGLFLIIAFGCLLLGTVLVLVTRRRRRTGATAALLILSVVCAGFLIPPGTPAQASNFDCGTTDAQNSLTVTQTSTMDNLAPGRAPVAITGLVVNNSLDSTYITAVEVRITSVTVQPGSPPGACDASDYFLLGSTMAVKRTVGPGRSVPFTGASIGLGNKPVNQDACQHAAIHLLYTANPG